MTSCISDNNINIDRLVLSAADIEDRVHRTIMYVEGEKDDILNATRQLEGMEGVIKVNLFFTNEDYVEKELCLVKMLSAEPTVSWVMNSVSELEGRTISTKNGVMIFQLEGTEEQITDFINQLTSFTKNVEVIRSGMVATSTNKEIVNLQVLEDYFKKNNPEGENTTEGKISELF